MTWQRERIIRKIFKIAIWVAPFVLFIWIADKNFVPGGKLEIKYTPTSNSKLISNFASKEKDKLIGTKNEPGNEDYFQLITTSPLYFNVKAPRLFPKATVKITYQNPDIQPVIKLGIRQASDAYFYKNLAFLLPELERLPDYWQLISQGDVVLWQKNKEHFEKFKIIENWRSNEIRLLDDLYGADKSLTTDSGQKEYEASLEEINQQYQESIDNIVVDNTSLVYNSVEDFLNDIPELSRIAQYNFDLGEYAEMPGYKKKNEVTIIDKSIRGKHDIYTYVGKDEDLNFTFTIQDINRHKGEDNFSVKVFNSKGKLIKELALKDDGITEGTGKVLPERQLKVLLEDIPFGVYRLLIDVSDDDLFIKKIVTFQQLITFKSTIYLTDNIEYKDILGDKFLNQTTLYTDSKVVRARTAHEKGLQTLRVGSAELVIDERHKLISIYDLEGITQIISPVNDVYMEGTGLFSFTRDQLFDPFYNFATNVTAAENLNDFDFIISNYPKAEVADGWLVAETTVEVPNLYLGNGDEPTAQFILSLPGLPENKRHLKIKEVLVTYEKEPITALNFISRLRNYLIGIFK